MRQDSALFEKDGKISVWRPCFADFVQMIFR